MNDLNIPNLRYREYLSTDVVRVVNPKQSKLYIKHGVFPVDLYTVQDYKTGDDILMMIFFKDETKDLYDAWIRHDLS